MFPFTVSVIKRRRYVVFLSLNLLLNACQHAPVSHSVKPVPLGDLTKRHTNQLESIQAFKLESKIAIQYADKGYSGRMHWMHTTDEDQLQLLSPFGQQVAVIMRTAQQASLIDQQQRTHTAANVETLTQQLLGWSLPLTDLPYWAIGLPAPSGPVQTQYNATGYLQQLVQDGWRIQYDDYRLLTETQAPNLSEQAFSNIVLPYSIELQRLTSNNQGAEPGLKIRLRVLTWQGD